MSTSSRDALVDQFKGLVREIADSLKPKTTPVVSVDDLHAVGIIMLIEIADRNDPDRRATLGAYIRRRVRGAMMDELRGEKSHAGIDAADIPDWRLRPADVAIISGEVQLLTGRLSPKQQRVIEMRKKDCSLAEIGRELGGISAQAVSRIEKRALARLAKLAA